MYGALLALLFVYLSARVILARRANNVSLGDGDHHALKKAIRAHGNFIEYVPITLLLMIFVQSLGGRRWQLHMIGLLILSGRLIHAYGLTRKNEVNPLRIVGMVLTFSAIISASIICLLRTEWWRL